MRVRFGDLEQLRADPGAFMRRVRENSRFGRWSYRRATTCAIYKLHAGSAPEDCVVYLRNLFASVKLTNAERRDGAERDFESYVEQIRTAKPNVFGVRQRVALDPSPDLRVGGEINRLDLNLSSGGYDVVQFSDGGDWERELRMPLIQRAVAYSLGVEDSLVSVRGQIIGSAEGTGRIYTVKQIDTAEREVLRLLRRGIEATS